MAAPIGNSFSSRRRLTALERFLSFCRFEPETGCVVWVGGRTMGRGHHAPYGAFWFEGRRWFAHRWAAKFIHGQPIDGFQTDHCCDTIPRPNTLCVQHLQSVTDDEHRALGRRRAAILVQVGALQYEDVYGPDPGELDLIPFYSPPAWLTQGQAHDHDCPF